MPPQRPCADDPKAAKCGDVPGSYSKAMVQTSKGATQNPWIVHMRKCAEEYRKEREAKAAPKKRLRKTSPEMSDQEPEAKPAPKKRLRKKTSPDMPVKEMPVAEPQPRRRLTKKTPDPAAPPAAPPPVAAAVKRRILKKMAPPEAVASPAPAPKHRLTKKTPTIHSRWLNSLP